MSIIMYPPPIKASTDKIVLFSFLIKAKKVSNNAELRSAIGRKTFIANHNMTKTIIPTPISQLIIVV